MSNKKVSQLFLLPIFLIVFLAGEFFFLNSSFAQEESSIPEWVKRIEYSFQWETDKKPTFYFQTVQPLYQNEEKIDTVFIQPRVNIREERSSYNLGVGYRRLFSENLILGINTFLDYQDLHRHGRAGVGVEALGQILEARLNAYIAGITPKRVVKSVTSSDTVEEVADGLDWELGMPLPYLPWLKLYGSGFWYKFDKFSDKLGWKGRLEARINDGLRLEGYVWDDNKGDLEVGGRIRFNVSFDNLLDIKNAFKFSSESFPSKDLRKELLIPVEREFDVIVEKWTETNGLVVEAGRS